MRRGRAFTLVELLVVIGIIAVLVALLLPVLMGARKSAERIKCAASLRECGTAMLFYVLENKGYLPCPHITIPYDIDSLHYDKGLAADVAGVSIAEDAHWYNLIAKYVYKAKTGNMPQTAEQMADVRKSVVWGCPSYIPIQTASQASNLQGGVNRNAPGYGMNWWPTFTATYPAPAQSTAYPPQSENFEWNANPSQGKWYKLTQFKQPSDRALLGDSRWFTLEARPVAATGFIPGQRLNWYPALYSTPGATGRRQTTFDFYRHGAYPKVEDPDLQLGNFSPDGGKVSYNVLYADNHVASATDRQTAYRVLRMRFPL